MAIEVVNNCSFTLYGNAIFLEHDFFGNADDTDSHGSFYLDTYYIVCVILCTNKIKSVSFLSSAFQKKSRSKKIAFPYKVNEQLLTTSIAIN